MSKQTDEHNPLAHEPFSFTATKNGALHLHARGRIVKTLRGKDAVRLLSKLESADAAARQMLLAKATGQFKFGNERR